LLNYAKVIINQNELPDECYSGVKKDSTVKTAWNSNIPNVFTVELDSISEVIIDPRDESKIAEVWYSNAKQGIKDLCLHCNQTQASSNRLYEIQSICSRMGWCKL
jgi:hypothetical protein